MTKPTRRLSSPFLAGVTAAALVTCWLTPTPAVAAALQGASAKASVLSLEGDDPAKAVGLSKALQSEFTRRGFSGGREMSLAELKLTMGCDEPPSAACLASGGKTLGVDRMAYGTLTKKGAGYTLNINVMEVGSATVSQSVSVELSADALADVSLAATAKDVGVKVLGPEAAVPPPVVGPVEGPKVEDSPPPDKQGKYIWGKYDAPTWKKAGLGASAALTVVGLGVAIGTYIQIRPEGPIKKELIAAGRASLDDDKKSNDINPNTPDDLCDRARTPPGENPDEVTNKDMAIICNKGDALAKVSTVGWIATGVFLGATLVFTTLLFVHKRGPNTMALQRRGFSMGMAPNRGGFVVGTQFKF
jgi:hypothetical protein